MKYSAKLNTKTHVVYQGVDARFWDILATLLMTTDQSMKSLSILDTQDRSNGDTVNREMIFCDEDTNPLSVYAGFTSIDTDDLGTLVIDLRVLRYFIFGMDMSLYDLQRNPIDKKLVIQVKKYLRGQAVAFVGMEAL